MNNKTKVLTIIGPTASGKTSLSIKLAEQFDGEIISADSRQVYRGIDLLSGKVTAEEQHGITHHLLDIADPATTIYTADDFIHDAKKSIGTITSRHKLPIIAGGTFFYIDSLLGTYSLPQIPPNNTLRTTLEKMTTPELYERLKVHDPERAETIDPANRRRLIRALEIIDVLGMVPKLTTQRTYDVFSVGIQIPTDILHHNIHVRLRERLEQGMLEEATHLLNNGVTHERMEALGLECRYCSRHLRGVLTHPDMVSELETKIRQYAKRQMTWLKRDKTIHWYNPKNQDEFITMCNNITQWQRG